MFTHVFVVPSFRQGNASHRCHGRLEEDAALPKKRSRSGATQVSGNNNNVTWHSTSLTRADRWKDHKGAVLWFTGLSGSGKSCIANQVECMLHQRNVRTYVLDGDNLRHGLCSDLGFSSHDRWENLKRAAHVAKLMADAGFVVLCAFVSPYRLHREKVKTILTEDDITFFEIHVNANLATCEARDPKGLYLKARAGILRNFTGISDPYEEPTNPDLFLNSDENSVICLAEQVVNYLDLFLTSSGKV
jgi:adenylylsulfate kinase